MRLLRLALLVGLAGCGRDAEKHDCYQASDCTAGRICLGGRCGEVSEPCPGCQLTAAGPALSASGRTLSLEGTFATDTFVRFPGGAAPEVTLLGPHRATVMVPGTATAGDLAVTIHGREWTVPFRSPSFLPGLDDAGARRLETSVAKQEFRLPAGRTGFASVVLGQHLYLIGGVDAASGGLAPGIQRAVLDADGTIEPLREVDGFKLERLRRDAALVLVRPYLYVFGGVDSEGNPLGTVERARIDASPLSPFTRLDEVTLVPRSRMSAVVLGDSIYLLGGEAADPKSGQSRVLDDVERLEVKPDGSLAPRPVQGRLATARAGAVAVVGDALPGRTGPTAHHRLYLIGGSGGDGQALASADRAAIDADGNLAFETVGPLLREPRADATLAVLGNGVHLLGGRDGATARDTIERADLDDDGELGPFALLGGRLRDPREGGGVAVAGNTLWLFGGSSGAAGLTRADPIAFDRGAEVQVTTPDRDKTQAYLAIPRVYHSMVVLGRYVYVLGGYATSGSLADVSRGTLDPRGTIDDWTPVAHLHAPRWGASLAVIGDRLYVIGGGNSKALDTAEWSSTLVDGQLSFPDTHDLPLLTTPRRSHGTVIAGDYLYLLGGTPAGDTAVDTIERARIVGDQLDPFEPYPERLALPRKAFATAVVGDVLYLLGGEGENGAATGSTERWRIGADGSLSPLGTDPLRGRRAASSSALVGQRLLVLGGYGNDGPGGTTDPTLDSSEVCDAGPPWACAPGFPLEHAHRGHTSVVIGDQLFTVAGAYPGMYLGYYERAGLQ